MQPLLRNMTARRCWRQDTRTSLPSTCCARPATCGASSMPPRRRFVGCCGRATVKGGQKYFVLAAESLPAEVKRRPRSGPAAPPKRRGASPAFAMQLNARSAQD